MKSGLLQGAITFIMSAVGLAVLNLKGELLLIFYIIVLVTALVSFANGLFSQ